MTYKELLYNIRENRIINSFIPLEKIFITPKIIKKNGRLTAELYYMTSNGRYTLYPVSHRVLYDIESAKPILMENMAVNNQEISNPLGGYDELCIKNGIDITVMQSYIDIFEKIINSPETINDELIEEASSIWETCVPVEIKNTIFMEE